LAQAIEAQAIFARCAASSFSIELWQSSVGLAVMGILRAVASILSGVLVAGCVGESEATAPILSDQASHSCKTDSSGSCVVGKSEGSLLLQMAQQLEAGTIHDQEVEDQGLFPSTCRSKTEKLEYAVNVALKCGAALRDAWTCLETLASPLSFMDCVKAVHKNTACNEAITTGCGVLEPKCSRCKTNTPMSNQKHGCLLEIYKGDSSSAACKLLEYSSGRYPRKWLRSGKDNYRFYGSCSEAKGEFAEHVMCPTPWTDWQ